MGPAGSDRSLPAADHAKKHNAVIHSVRDISRKEFAYGRRRIVDVRVLWHNPVAALYTSHSYYKKLREQNFGE
jgi:hypothetical protein